MFRDVPGCSGIFHVPGFIDGLHLIPCPSKSKLCLPGSHYMSSFRELSKSICIVFLFQNFRELAPELPAVASFENYPIRSAQVQSPLAEVRAPK